MTERPGTAPSSVGQEQAPSQATENLVAAGADILPAPASVGKMRRPRLARNYEYYRDLVVEIVKVELKTRHFQRLLGPAWWLLDPVLYALMFFFLTTVLFRQSSGPGFLLFILTMVIAWRWFSKSVDGAPTAVLAYQTVIKQTVFPSLILPLAFAAVEMAFFAFGFAVLLGVLLLAGVRFSWVIIHLPIIMLVQLTFTLALVTFLSAAGVFLRDLNQVVYLVTGIWFYLSPGIYPVERIPERIRFVYYLNPFATILPAYKSVLLDAVVPNFSGLFTWLAVSVVLLGLSVRFFRSVQPKFFKVL